MDCKYNYNKSDKVFGLPYVYQHTFYVLEHNMEDRFLYHDMYGSLRKERVCVISEVFTLFLLGTFVSTSMYSCT